MAGRLMKILKRKDRLTQQVLDIGTWYGSGSGFKPWRQRLTVAKLSINEGLEKFLLLDITFEKERATIIK